MMDIDNFIVSDQMSIIDVLKVIDKNSKGIAFICDNYKLLAVVTDGDIRRYILNNGNVKDLVSTIANYSPKYLENEKNYNRTSYMKRNSITAVPIINKEGKIISIDFLYDNKKIVKNKLNIPVVIMAGGKGTRLYPYTQILPKPLIPIGEKTITEIIMDKFELYGCSHFDMILNYKKNFIKSFFLDNEHQRDIDFIDEGKFLGTGGGLKLIEGKYENSIIVTNCDIIIDEDYGEIIKYHRREKNIITIVSAIKNVVIPYGTIELLGNGQVSGLTEKPQFTFLTNTGLYIIEPAFISKIPKDTFIHITDVIQSCVDSGEKVGVYPVGEHSWMDMGQMEELEKMRERLAGNGEI